MPAPNYTELNMHEPNRQASRILSAHRIPWSPASELASLALIRHALENGDLETPTIPEPLLLVAKLAADPEQTMRLLTESAPGETYEIEMDEDPVEAAAQLLEEILASIRSRSPTQPL
jgi:hypothetical protein